MHSLLLAGLCATFVAATSAPADKEEKKPEAKKDEKTTSDKGEAGMEVKIIGRGSWRPAGKGEAQQVVIRTAEELAKAAGLEKPDEEATQKKATETVAKALKVDDIDWKKEMVIAVSAGMKTTGGYKVEVTKIDVADKVMTVHWTLHTPGPRSPVTATITHPAQSVVVERFAGKVVFDQTTAKGGDKDK